MPFSIDLGISRNHDLLLRFSISTGSYEVLLVKSDSFLCQYIATIIGYFISAVVINGCFQHSSISPRVQSVVNKTLKPLQFQLNLKRVRVQI